MIREVVYVPGGGDIDQAVQRGAAWLREQRGDKLVLVPEMRAYRANETLGRLTAGVKVAK